MKLFDKRNIVLIMSIFLLLLMVSSVSAADVSEDAVVGNDAAIDTITSTDTSGSIDDVISAEVSDNPKADPSDSNESLSGDIVADASSNNDNSNQNTVDDSSQDVLKASSDEEVLGVTFDRTVTVGPVRQADYRTLAAAINGLDNYRGNLEIVILDGTYSANGFHDVNVQKYFDNYVWLIRAQNPGKVTLDGLHTNRLLTINSPNVMIEGINFVNANASDYSSDGGVCISIGGQAHDVSINNCNFTNNGKNGTYGGAIRINYEMVIWGLLYNYAHNINITNCYFENNTADVGGGIRSEQGTYGIHVVNCTAVHNYGAIHGGFACLFGDDTVLENCSFEDNYAPSSGAVHCHSGNVTVKNCTFVNNSAIGGGTNGYAGALGLVYAGSPGVTVLDSHFYNNTAVNDGGAVQVMGTGRDAKIINSDFENNTAAYGGAVSIKGTNTVITDSNFTDCNASQYGGAVQVIGSGTNINNCNFEENNALPDEDKKDDGLGGAVYIQGTNCHVTDSNFTHNTARNGSAIYVNPNGTGDNYINNCVFVENQAWVYWLPILYDNETHKIETNLTGGNNILNAIYNNGSNRRLYINDTNPVLGWENSDGGRIPYQDDLENEQAIVITVYDRNGNVVYYNDTLKTNLSGTVSVDIPTDTSSWFIINITHTEDHYYKYITNITAININPGVTVDNVTMYEGNESAQEVVVDVVDGNKPVANATINLTVIVNDQPIEIGYGNTSDKGVFQISEETLFKTLAPGEYKIQATCTYLYYNVTTGKNETKTVVGNGTLKVLPYVWDLTKTIIAVNGQPYTEGMEIHVYDNVTFNITVSNQVDADITSLKLVDLDTNSLHFIGSKESDWSYINNYWTLANLAAKQNSSLILTFNITQVGESINVATASIFNGKEEKSAEASLTADKCPSSVNGTDVTVVYGEDIVVTVASENATAVIYNITNAAGVVVADTPMAANGTISGLVLAVGEYTVNYVTVVDGDYYYTATGTSKIFVTPAPSSVNGTDVTVVYGEDIVVTVASENATAVIYNITNAAGVVVADTPMAANGTISGLGLAVGEYTVNYVTVVDANHTVATNTSKIIVTPAPSAVSAEDVEVTYGEPITVNVASENATGVTYVITGEGVELSGTVQDGVITIDKDYLLAGEYTVTLTTQVDANHTVANNTSKITVNRLSIIIETTTTISDASGKPGETVTLDVEVTTEDGTPFNGDVVITCPDGKKVTVTVKDGKGQFDWTIPEDAKAGDEYQFTATFKGNSTYLASSGNGTVSVYEDEPQPEPPVPEEPEEPVPEVVPAKMLNTGNPLVALLAAFVLIGLGLKRREEE